MNNRILIEDCNLEDEMAQVLGYQPVRGKDVTPHHIPNTNLRLGEFTTDIKPLDKGVLDRADASLVSTDSGSYLRDVGVSTADLVGRLRHRATLMRQRADEFDTMADLHEGASFQSVRTAIERHDELSQEIEALLKRHAHVNPTAVRT